MGISTQSKLLKSILVVDDDADSLKLYSHLLKAKTRAHIVSVRHPTEALHLAFTHLFDIILIDVTINYNGTPLGGMELYNSLVARYGDASLIAYSRFITDDLFKQYGFNFNFVDSGTDSISFVLAARTKMLSLRKKQTCFVAMPFDKKYRDLYDVLRGAIESCDYSCIRVDKQQFTSSIVDKIFDDIKNAKLIVFVADGQNPNVFYEGGYALAHKKEIITVTEAYEDLPFDIRDRNTIAYAGNLRRLKTQLNEKLRNLTL